MDTPVTEAKRTMRLAMRRRRAALVDRSERSELIWERVMALCNSAVAERTADGTAESAASSALVVMAFNGIGSEPDTTGLVESLAAAGHAVLLPRVEGDHIVAVAHRPGDVLRRGAFGIAEPLGPAVDPQSIDAVIVPGLAFTRDGRRLGQGGGYYDQFLPTLRSGCITCGVGFSTQIVDDLPVEPHDRPLTMVLTDEHAQFDA